MIRTITPYLKRAPFYIACNGLLTEVREVREYSPAADQWFESLLGCSLQLCVFRFRFFQDWDAGVSVFYRECCNQKFSSMVTFCSNVRRL